MAGASSSASRCVSRPRARQERSRRRCVATRASHVAAVTSELDHVHVAGSALSTLWTCTTRHAVVSSPTMSPIPSRPLRSDAIAVFTVAMFPAGMSPPLFTHVVATPGRYIRPFFCDRVALHDFLMSSATLGGSTSLAETVPVEGCPATLLRNPDVPLKLSR